MEKVKAYDGFVPSSFWGVMVKASIAQLEKLFGVQATYQDDEKSKYELELIADEIPFNIYDWKEWWLDENTIVWLHVGTNLKSESKEIAEILRGYDLNVYERGW